MFMFFFLRIFPSIFEFSSFSFLSFSCFVILVVMFFFFAQFVFMILVRFFCEMFFVFYFCDGHFTFSTCGLMWSCKTFKLKNFNVQISNLATNNKTNLISCPVKFEN